MSNAYPTIAEVQARIDEATQECARRLAEAMYPLATGTYVRPAPIPWSRRLAGWWYGVREWIAVKLLRIEVREDG